jgi:hypothetical protein
MHFFKEFVGKMKECNVLGVLQKFLFTDSNSIVIGPQNFINLILEQKKFKREKTFQCGRNGKKSLHQAT